LGRGVVRRGGPTSSCQRLIGLPFAFYAALSPPLPSDQQVAARLSAVNLVFTHVSRVYPDAAVGIDDEVLVVRVSRGEFQRCGSARAGLPEDPHALSANTQ